jgi:hypothetical protein
MADSIHVGDGVGDLRGRPDVSLDVPIGCRWYVGAVVAERDDHMPAAGQRRGHSVSEEARSSSDQDSHSSVRLVSVEGPLDVR